MTVVVDEDQYLAHYGILRKSGRYPWGSGNTQSARNRTFLAMVDDLKKKGMTDAQIAEAFSTPGHKLTSTQIVALRSIAGNQQKQEQINMAQRLKDKGLSNIAIGDRMNINESTVRSLLAPGRKEKIDILQSTADMLKRQVEEKKFLDVGLGAEHTLPIFGNEKAPIGISKDKLRTAVTMLQEEGYQVHTNIFVKQAGTGLDTQYKVLTKPGVSRKEVWDNINNIRQISEHSDNEGRPGSWTDLRPPSNISSKRIAVAYGDKGGAEKDGLIEIRPGAKDLDLGAARYAQVRIAVDGTHYLKGMAVYNDKLPPGVDVRFNTNKKDTGNKLDALKPQEKLPDGTVNKKNPFNAAIKPGGQRGALNIINEEGDWDKFKESLPSQMLSKQKPSLAATQLKMTYERRKKEFEEISALTNPAVKKKLLKSFSDETDAAAVHLQAAGLRGQSSKVVLPIPSMKEHEVFAPSYENGTQVALVRFPHGGTFEIPLLTVNNRNPEAKRLIGHNATDAIGIHHKVAERLSGADFDGDHVLIIPNRNKEITSKPPLEGLRGFDPKSAHPPYDGMLTINGGRYNAKTGEVEFKDGAKPKPKNMQLQMGKISNLITDMTIKGATDAELARAVRHSMVIIDAEKHALDYKSSFAANGIPALKEKYQGGKNAGSATLISRAGSPERIPTRKPRSAAEGGPIDKKTGKLVFVPKDESYVNRHGKTIVKTQEVQKLANRDNAHSLVSDHGGTKTEHIYADHSNQLKDLANTARKEMVNTANVKRNPSSAKVYEKEVASLESKVLVAEKNAPRERQAQVIQKAMVEQRVQANPNLDPDQIKKIRNQSLVLARDRVGAKKIPVDITNKEWEAIQNGAISNHMLEKILNNADLTQVKQLATPIKRDVMTSTKQSRARQMLDSGYTQAEVARQLGVSLSTLKTSLAGE